MISGGHYLLPLAALYQMDGDSPLTHASNLLQPPSNSPY